MTIAIEAEAGELASLQPGITPTNTIPTRCSVRPRTSAIFVRWCKFKLVGAIGIAVQFAALFLLKSGLHFNYLLATAIAVEIAVLHNFVWHERFTWADRVGLETKNFYGVNKIALSQQPSLRRLLRFHLANGLVSIVGNLALMKVMVGFGHVNYLAANAVAIAMCSLANFIASERWVFEEVLLGKN
jgi:putative flippase GtrA